jgi:hypothetical protein
MKVYRAALALALFGALALPRPSRADDPGAGSLIIFNGSKVVQALSYEGWDLKPDFNLMADPTVEGNVTASGGAGNDIQVLIFTDSQFLNWTNGHEVTPIYNSGQVTADDVHAVLPGPGVYHVILSNKFSAFTPKTVEGTLRMTWQPSAAVLAARRAAAEAAKAAADAQAAALAAQQKAANDASMRNMLLLVVAGAVLGAIVFAIVQRKKTGPEKGAAEKKAA